MNKITVSENYRKTNENNLDYSKARDLKNSWHLGKYNFLTEKCPSLGIKDVEPSTLYIIGQICDPPPKYARTLGFGRTSDGVVMLTLVDVPLSRDQIETLRKQE